MPVDLWLQDKSARDRGRRGVGGGHWSRDSLIRPHHRHDSNGERSRTSAAARHLPRTFAADFTGTDEVALVPRQDDGRLRLGLPEQEAELRSAVEASPVGHREDQDAHVALQCGQVLDVQNKRSEVRSQRRASGIKQRGGASISSDCMDERWRCAGMPGSRDVRQPH